ncbi:MAG: hypothetical protein GF421_10320 [Candidatus Aminicenantes bacterium]|nr:hypothetical protein [Candidatus Aminicenantes bacterium]
MLNEKRQNTKVVLRVPIKYEQYRAEARVTQEEIALRNRIYDAFEKELFKAGFIVRDRALLQKVLEGDPSDYSKVAKQIDTDIIIEIDRIEMVNLSHRTYFYPETGQYGQLIDKFQDGTEGPYFKLEGGILECRVISVDQGAVTGLFTILDFPNLGYVEFEVIENSQMPRNPLPNPRNYFGYGVGTALDNARNLALLLIQTLLNYKMVIEEVSLTAESSGLKNGDIVLSINGQEMLNHSQAFEYISKSQGTLEFEVQRGDEKLVIPVFKNANTQLGLRYRFKKL